MVEYRLGFNLSAMQSPDWHYRSKLNNEPITIQRMAEFIKILPDFLVEHHQRSLHFISGIVSIHYNNQLFRDFPCNEEMKTKHILLAPRPRVN